jgi:hypothetical protein
MHRPSSSVVLLTSLCFVAQCAPPSSAIAPGMQDALDGIHASSLRDDLKFIASDELEGRDSPSPGLDRAADYIADQFRRAGLEPAVGNSYFQTASMAVESRDLTDFSLKLFSGHHRLEVTAKDVSVSRPAALDLKNAPVFKVDLNDQHLIEHLTPDQLNGKVVIVAADPKFRAALRSLARVLRESKPALYLAVEKREESPAAPGHRLVDLDDKDSGTAPRITLFARSSGRFYSALHPGDAGATATVHLATPVRTPATLRNVIGVLRGSDPALRSTAVLLTAHYDHLGVKPEGSGDRIYNGANDDGSGTVSVIEVARALARLPRHPRRSIVFMTFFGEEEGLIGSRYYAQHPVWPLDKTVADLNLEQVGRTDSSEGRELSNASLTGFDYSDLTRFVEDAGKSTGIKVYKDEKGSDPYFRQSDNFSLAEVGVPAETLCVAFEFPDYHAVGDEWQKIDYENMAKVDRAIALAMFLMADSEQPVRWNESNPKTAPYVKAAKEMK